MPWLIKLPTNYQHTTSKLYSIINTSILYTTKTTKTTNIIYNVSKTNSTMLCFLQCVYSRIYAQISGSCGSFGSFRHTVVVFCCFILVVALAVISKMEDI